MNQESPQKRKTLMGGNRGSLSPQRGAGTKSPNYAKGRMSPNYGKWGENDFVW